MLHPPSKLTTTFLGILLPDDIRTHLARLQIELQSHHFPISWENPDKLHLTLAFLGRITAEQTRIATQVITPLAVLTPPTPLAFNHLSYFYEKHGQGTLWIKIEDQHQQLVTFHKRLVSQLNLHDFSLSEKKLLPHVTLARLKRLPKPQQLEILDTLSSYPLPPIPEFTVTSLHLLTSRYRRDLNTTDYQIATEFPFQINQKLNSNI